MRYREDFIRGVMDKMADSGFGIPVGQAIDTISRDPFMSPNARKNLIDVVRTANDGSPRGLLGWDDVARTAVGFGAGRVTGNMIGRGLDYAVGGLSPKGRSRLSQIGGLVGALGGLRLIN